MADVKDKKTIQQERTKMALKYILIGGITIGVIFITLLISLITNTNCDDYASTDAFNYPEECRQ